MERQTYYVLAELSLLRTHHPAGIYVIPSPGNPLKWVGFVSVRSGYYTGGIFRLCVTLPGNFPSREVPRVFLPKSFFHPFVDRDTGELAMISAFSEWDPERDRLWHLFHHIRCLLTCPTGCIRQYSAEQIQLLTRPSSSSHKLPTSGPCLSYPNPEAADLIVNHKDRFQTLARECVKRLSVWSSDGPGHSTNGAESSDGGLNITGWDDESFLGQARQALEEYLKAKDQPACMLPVRGYSWLDVDTMNIFAARSSDSDHGET